MALRLTFAGGAGTVTGSNFLVEGEKGRMLVDCGIEQGRDFCEECTYAPFPYDVPSLDALVITHAHLDHIGRAPKLMREGFKGKVYTTEATRDLMQVMLADSAHILAQEARGRGREPLYNEEDVTNLMRRVEVLKYHEEHEVAPGLSVFLRNTGHILGSASVRIKDMSDGTTLALTGDIGNKPNPYLKDWEAVDDADALVMESVYGDRLHPHLENRVEHLRDVMKKAIERNGVILMPSFSMERTQLLLYELSNLMAAGELPQIPVFLDSPLAIKVTEVYERHIQDFNPAAQDEAKREKSIFRFPFLTMTESRDDSALIAQAPTPKLIIAGAGMSHGGRIGRWEQQYLPDPSTTLLIVGYQAPGSPGRMMQDGAPKVRIDGREVKLRAHVETLSAWSAHADRDGLLKFAEAALPHSKAIFVALGEPSSQRFLAQRIHDFLGGKAIVPKQGEVWEITKSGAKKV
ncbi:MAG: RNA-metabolising metallo-beta-lactamase, metallo-beta-lactamase family protein [Parcubacteria group bacterium]|nr:RNA-metabolising metallo-beta-lactamase, metallo-beta-lactamase family protein [Parcubacteria group bacterium]